MTLPEPCAVYRHFSETGCLLYVGRSIDPLRRWDALRLTERWTHLSARRTDQWLPTVAEAKVVERIAIKTESPVFNLQGVRGIRKSSAGSPHKRSVDMPDGTALRCWFDRGFGWMIGDEAIADYEREMRRRDLADQLFVDMIDRRYTERMLRKAGIRS